MHFTHSLAAILVLAGSSLSSPVEGRASVGLAQAMRARGRSWIGTAVTFRDDPKEAAIYGNKAGFNSITPENAQKVCTSREEKEWTEADVNVNSGSRPNRSVAISLCVHQSSGLDQLIEMLTGRQFEDADRYVDYATSHGIQIHCHNLVRHSQLPDWVTNGNFSNSELIDARPHQGSCRPVHGPVHSLGCC
jgi:endo-1,4-beta-xylanase